MRIARQAFTLVLMGVMACGGGGEPTTPGNNNNQNPGGGGGGGGGSTSNSIQVGDNSFTPDSTTVGTGTTVTWTWGSGYAPHNVTFTDGVKSQDQTTGTFTRTFSTNGKYVYNCTNHTGMRGVVMVQ